jgi:TPR repeat protein
MNALADVLLAMRSQSATTEAKRLLRLAVKKQNVRAKYLMGVVYYREGFTKNTQQLKRAFQLFDAAAATGYPPALAAAGLCLLNGIGTNRDERAGQDRLNAASQFVPLVSAQLRTTKGRV